jgi:signal transduction histidine kinase/ligand-binding sensor domain-containing protein
MRYQAHLINCLVLLLFQGVWAQQNGSLFYRLTTENGLSSNHAAAVIQDREGFYWIATTDGLNRFDGSTCMVFRNQKNDAHSLSHNNCIFLLEDDAGGIWVATQGGVNRFDKEKKIFDRFYLEHPFLPFEKANWIRGLAKDNKGNVYVASEGLWQYNTASHKWTAYLNDQLNLESPPAGSLSSLQFDSLQHGIWMTGEAGYVFFDLDKKVFYHRQNNPKHWLLFTKNCGGDAILMDKTGSIWFKDCETAKLSCFNPKTNTIRPTSYKFEHGFFKLSIDEEERIWIHNWGIRTLLYNPVSNELNTAFLTNHHPRSAADSIVYDLYLDKEKNYWISTPKGVSIYNPESQFVHYAVAPDDEKTPVTISSVLEQNGKTVWLGTNKGLYQYDPKQARLNKAAPAFPIHCMALVEDRWLWTGFRNQLFCLDLNKGKIIKKISLEGRIQFIKEDDQQSLWVGTWENGLYQFSKEGKLTGRATQGNGSSQNLWSNSLVGMSPVYKNHFWIGYNGGNGFARFDLATKTLSHYKVGSRAPVQNMCNSVSCIIEDEDQNVWLGTSGGGVVYFRPATGTFDIINQSDGLKSNYINSLLPDDSSRLWVSTSNGLSLIQRKTRQVINPDADLVFYSNDFVANGIKRKNKNLLFFSGNKIVEIVADHFFTIVKPSKILLSSFKVFNKEVAVVEGAAKNHIKLKYDQNFFSVEYSLLKAFPSVPVQYAYRLEGFDKDWNYVQERRAAYYTNVPAGNYTFNVKATDASGKWSYFSHPLAITVVPPVWQRAWFVTLSVLLLLFALYTGYHYRLRQLKKLYQLRTGISRDLHDEVASTLSGIRLYSEMAKQQLEQKDTGQVQKSLEVISDNAAEMMQGMSDIVWAINPANDSLSKLLQKLRSYAIEMIQPANISFSMEVDEALPEEKLNMQERRNIYLICKEAINNAVKYSSAKNLTVAVKRSGSLINLMIRDDGIGFTGEPVTGNGLLNMKMRAAQIGARIAINSGLSNGTTIEIQMKVS